MIKPKKEIYFAAALFSARETIFNSLLTEQFEKDGHRVRLPQRDGFEFANLHRHLTKHLRRAGAAEKSAALQTIIYLLDIGKFIYESDVVIANLDEPIDEGVVVEITYARLMDCPVVGYRTDVRSPFGNLDEPLRGMHFFPAFQCKDFIWHPIQAKTPEERKTDIKILSKKLYDCAQYYSNGRNMPSLIKKVTDAAFTLFHGIPDIHTDEGLNEIVKRYSVIRNEEIRKKYSLFGPKVHS